MSLTERYLELCLLMRSNTIIVPITRRPVTKRPWQSATWSCAYWCVAKHILSLLQDALLQNVPDRALPGVVLVDAQSLLSITPCVVCSLQSSGNSLKTNPKDLLKGESHENLCMFKKIITKNITLLIPWKLSSYLRRHSHLRGNKTEQNSKKKHNFCQICEICLFQSTFNIYL